MFFQELMALVDERPLFLSVTCDSEGMLTVNLVPQKLAAEKADDPQIKGKLLPLMVRGTPEEVDAHFLEEVRSFLDNRTRFLSSVKQAQSEFDTLLAEYKQGHAEKLEAEKKTAASKNKATSASKPKSDAKPTDKSDEGPKQDSLVDSTQAKAGEAAGSAPGVHTDSAAAPHERGAVPAARETTSASVQYSNKVEELLAKVGKGNGTAGEKTVPVRASKKAAASGPVAVADPASGPVAVAAPPAVPPRSEVAPEAANDNPFGDDVEVFGNDVEVVDYDPEKSPFDEDNGF